MASASNGTVNRVISLWKEWQNVAVISTTSPDFLRRLKRWAKEEGYRMEEMGRGKEKEEL